MKPFYVLVITFLLTSLIIKFWLPYSDYFLAGRIAMSAMLTFTATGHFAFTKGMSLMLPSFLPYKTQIVIGTGLLEIGAAIGLLVPKLQSLTGWLLIVFFICILPANIYAAVNNIDYQKATNNGPGMGYLWFRVPLQIVFIVWVYWCTINPVS